MKGRLATRLASLFLFKADSRFLHIPPCFRSFPVSVEDAAAEVGASVTEQNPDGTGAPSLLLLLLPRVMCGIWTPQRDPAPIRSQLFGGGFAWVHGCVLTRTHGRRSQNPASRWRWFVGCTPAGCYCSTLLSVCESARLA